MTLWDGIWGQVIKELNNHDNSAKCGGLSNVLMATAKYKEGDVVRVMGNKARIKKVHEDMGYSMYGNLTEYEVEFDDPLASTITTFPEATIMPWSDYSQNLEWSNKPKCECGVDSVKAGKHSTWCPKHGWE